MKSKKQIEDRIEVITNIIKFDKEDILTKIYDDVEIEKEIGIYERELKVLNWVLGE